MKQRQLYQRQKKANWSNDNIYKNHNALETDRTEGGHSADCANVNQKDSIHFYLTCGSWSVPLLVTPLQV